MPPPPRSFFRTGSTAGRGRSRKGARRSLALAAAVVAVGAGFVVLRGPSLPEGQVVVRVPAGATFRQVVDTLHDRQVVVRPFLFRVQARLRHLDGSVKAGTYRLSRGERHSVILRTLAEGRVETYPVTFPEGTTIKAMAARIAQVANMDSAAVVAALTADSLHETWSVPGPGLEGYLFPDTYRFAQGVDVDQVLSAMTRRYRSYWTPERRDRLTAVGMSEREAATLASIIQAEAVHSSEMATISSVYHNRLRTGMPLQADPTVLYALGGHRPRLLYAAMDSVADHPYNTYAHAGLPPGPIGAPGGAALDAALNPAETDYFYFVARSDGRHVFSRSLREHNNARIRIRRES